MYKVFLRDAGNVKSRGRRKAKRETPVTHVYTFSTYTGVTRTHKDKPHSLLFLEETCGMSYLNSALLQRKSSSINKREECDSGGCTMC